MRRDIEFARKLLIAVENMAGDNPPDDGCPF